MKAKISYLGYKLIPTMEDVLKYEYYYKIVNDKYSGTSLEEDNSVYHSMIVSITGRLSAVWLFNGLNKNYFYKVLFEFGRRHLIDSIKDGVINEPEVTSITSLSGHEKCPYDPKKIPEPSDHSEVIVTSVNRLVHN